MQDLYFGVLNNLKNQRKNNINILSVMAIQKSSAILSVYNNVPRISIKKNQKSLSVNMKPVVRIKAKIPDDLKAGGTFVKKMRVVITKDGPKVNLIR